MQLSDDDQHVQVGDVAHYDLHRRFQKGHANYDVAVLHLKTNFEENNNFIRPICLQSVSSKPISLKAVAVIGWGTGLLDEGFNAAQELQHLKFSVMITVTRWSKTEIKQESLEKTCFVQGMRRGVLKDPVLVIQEAQSSP